MEENSSSNSTMTVAIVVVVLVVLAVVAFLLLRNPSATNNTTANNTVTNTTTTNTTTTNTTTNTTTDVPVSISNMAFPATTTIKRGQTVVWTNNDSTQHNVTFTTGTSSGLLSKGNTFSRVFDAVGEFDYTCTIHPGMKGKIIVTE